MTVTGRSNGLAFDFVYESLRLTGRLIIQASTYAHWLAHLQLSQRGHFAGDGPSSLLLYSRK